MQMIGDTGTQQALMEKQSQQQQQQQHWRLTSRNKTSPWPPGKPTRKSIASE
jgi:hypothetical protein